MMKLWKKAICATAIIVLIGIAAGCSGKKNVSEPEPANSPEVNTEPVTLKIMRLGTELSKEVAEQIISRPVKQKYPHITIEYMEPTTSLANLLAAGRTADIPDIIFTDYSNLSSVIDLKYPADLNATLKRLKTDLNKLEPSSVEAVRGLVKNGQLLALPIYLDKYMMFYNKDVFDKFAVPYPKGDMTYEDLLTLSRRLTRSEGGVQYYAYRWADLYTVGYQFGLPVISPKTGRADLQTDGWKYALNFIKQMNDMGNVSKDKVTHDAFFKEKRLAIYPQWMGAAYNLLLNAPGLNWDMGPMPNHRDTPKVSGPAKPIYLMAFTESKNKEQTMMAIAHLTSSPDVQTIISETGRISVLNDEEIKKKFGSKVDLLKGKQTSAVFQYPFGKLPHTTAYESQAWDGLDTAPASIMNGVDVNTALRTAEEAANKKVDEYLNNRK